MKAIQAIMKVLVTLVWAVIIVLIVTAAPIAAGYRPVIILSPSMEPGYPVGSICYYKHASFEDIEAGNTITFGLGDSSSATHRVVEIDDENQTFVTKGDNNPSNDTSPVAYDRVLGKTTDFAIPYLGYFTDYVKSNVYIIIAMGVILLASMFLVPAKKKPTKKVSAGSPHSAAGAKPEAMGAHSPAAMHVSASPQVAVATSGVAGAAQVATPQVSRQASSFSEAPASRVETAPVQEAAPQVAPVAAHVAQEQGSQMPSIASSGMGNVAEEKSSFFEVPVQAKFEMPPKELPKKKKAVTAQEYFKDL